MFFGGCGDTGLASALLLLLLMLLLLLLMLLLMLLLLFEAVIADEDCCCACMPNWLLALGANGLDGALFDLDLESSIWIFAVNFTR